MRRWLILALLAVVPAACAGILGLRKSNHRPFEHRPHVLEGIACTKCHQGITEAGDDGPLHLPSDDDCIACHEKPHDTRPCAGCHGQPYTAQDLIQNKRHLAFSHKSHAARMKGNCVTCHRGIAHAGERLRPSMATCLSCHEHKDQFKIRDCEGCHVDLPGELSKPASHLVHGPDFIREHGVRANAAGDLCSTCHRESFCADCHGATTAALPSRLAFDQPMKAGMHRAGFAARHSEAARADAGLCLSCHTESSCRGCHDRKQVAASTTTARRNPHPPNWVGVGAGNNQHGRAARLDPVGCASCHGGAGEALCVSCHQVGGVGGNPHPANFDSRLSLTDLPCRLCHRTTP